MSHSRFHVTTVEELYRYVWDSIGLEWVPETGAPITGGVAPVARLHPFARSPVIFEEHRYVFDSGPLEWVPQEP